MGKKLPIGTIIKLFELDKLFMIVGYCNNMNLKKLNNFDYLVCGYPEGVIGLKRTILVKNAEIEKIIYNGFNNNNDKVNYDGEK